MDRAPKTVCVAIIRKGLSLGLPSEDKHCWIVSAEFGDTTAGSKPVYLISSGIRPTCREALVARLFPSRPCELINKYKACHKNSPVLIRFIFFSLQNPPAIP